MIVFLQQQRHSMATGLPVDSPRTDKQDVQMISAFDMGMQQKEVKCG